MPLLSDKYQFWFHDGEDPISQIYPSNEAIEFNFARPENCIFFRNTLATELKLVAEDFQYLYDIEKATGCASAYIQIKKYCSGLWHDYYMGRFEFRYAKWDLTDCTVTGKLITMDKYQPMFDLMDVEVDVFAATVVPRVTAGTSVGRVHIKRQNPVGEYQSDNPDDFDLEPDVLDWYPPGFTNWLRTKTYDENQETWYSNDIIVREEVEGLTMPPGDGWFEEDGMWVRPVRTEGRKISTNKQVDGAYEIGINNQFYDFVRYAQSTKPIIHFRNGVKLIDVLDRLCPGNLPADLISNFFDYNADATNPDNYAYEYAADNLDNVVLWTMSDIIRPRASKAATKFILKLSDLLNDLRTSMNVYWDINDDGKILLEHFSYFKYQQILFDLTGIDKRDYLVGHSKYEYLNIRPHYEKFTWGIEPKNKHFNMPRVQYFQCYEEKTEGINAILVTPDIVGEYMAERVPLYTWNLGDYNINLPASDGSGPVRETFDAELFQIPDDTEIENEIFAGFVIANVKSWNDINYIPEFSVPNYQLLGNASPVNGALSLSSMAIPLLSWDRHGNSRLEGNTFQFTANYPRPERKQDEFWVPYCCDDNWEPANLIKTQFAVCGIESATLKEPEGKLYLKPQFI